MGRISKRELLTITEAVRKGEEGATAAKAIMEITSGGIDYLAVGTAVSSEFHYPVPALEAHAPVDDTEDPHWGLRIPNETGYTVPILRAGSVASTAIHAAFGGDINFPQQRLRTGHLLASPSNYYHGPTHGWEYDSETNAYTLKIHRDYLDATTDTPDDEIVGAVDFVNGDCFGLPIPDEPGHYGSFVIQERQGSLPVRMGDVRENIAASAIRYYTYEPLHLRDSSIREEI